MKKEKNKLLDSIKSPKIERNFLKTNTGKTMFYILTLGIITITIGFGIVLFETILFLMDKNINEYSFLINLGILSAIIGLICNTIYFVSYTQYKNKKQKN